MSVLDTLIQSSTVALFHTVGIAVAPLAPVNTTLEEFSPSYPVGLANLEASFIKGSLWLSLPSDLYPLLQRAEPSADARDLLRELTNQLLGRIKNRLTQYQVVLNSSLPRCIERHIDRRLGLTPVPLAVYRFRTIRGHVEVGLQGRVDESKLVYAATIKLNSEGDVILF